MCGINGIYAYKKNTDCPNRKELIATRDHMFARGPDSSGEWWSGHRRLALAHRRLAIIDLSDRATQPMISDCGRFVIVFNGEIYNYLSIRHELETEGVAFQTSSDTEVLLHLYARRRGAMVEFLRGMFAFAIWDNLEGTLFLARDPYGIKPLYTSNDGGTFRFASQVKALLAGGKISRDPDPAGIVGFQIWGSVPEPFTLYKKICQLPAGHTQWIDGDVAHEPVPYASVAEELKIGADHPLKGIEAVNSQVRAATRESVAAHLVADVEVGIFLSAGVDSAALLGLMRDTGQNKILGITLRFEEFGETTEDEAPIAKEIAKLYGADHLVRTVTEKEFRADLPAMLEAMDQPSIDGINSWFVAKAAREAGLKVALSGVGGDELFAGYPSFSDIPRWVTRTAVPGAVPGLGVAMRVLLDQLGLAQRSPKAAAILEYGGTYAGAYLLRRGLFLPHELHGIVDSSILKLGLNKLNLLARIRDSINPDPKSPISKVAALESCNYMRNQLLRDGDWAGMAHSVEIRTPLVDFSLLKAVSSAIPHFTAGEGKRALFSAPEKPLPNHIINRPKTGFSIPLHDWLAPASNAGGWGKGAASRAWSKEVLASFAIGLDIR